MELYQLSLWLIFLILFFIVITLILCFSRAINLFLARENVLLIPPTFVHTPSLIAKQQIQSPAYFQIAWMLFRLKSVWEISNALLVHDLLTEAPSSTQPECHGQELKEGSTGERWSQCHEVPEGFSCHVWKGMSHARGITRAVGHVLQRWHLGRIEQPDFPLSKMSVANFVVLPPT